MDIVTHAGLGLIAAAPAINAQPELALGIVAGSVLPDLDALGASFRQNSIPARPSNLESCDSGLCAGSIVSYESTDPD